jgi:hypothetical protein
VTLDQYLLHALAWSLAGGIAGVLLDRAVLALQQIAHATPQEDAVPDHSTPRKRFRRWFNRAVVPGVLITMAVLTIVQSVIAARTNAAQDVEIKRVQACQLEYANKFADAIDARSTTTAAAQDAVDELWATIGRLMTGGASPTAREEFQAALSDYLAKRATAKKKQQDNPYPPAPRDLCK